MCYSTTLTESEAEIEKETKRQFRYPMEYEPYFYQSAFNHGNLYIIPQKEPKLIRPAMWGLVPKWAMKGDISDFLKKNYTNNARSESIFDKKSFKDFPVTNRCLILANGFFEPHHEAGNAYPYFCHHPDNSLFLFAGLYSELDEELHSCTIITVEANEQFEKVHNKKKRMPLVLDPELTEEWLRDDLNEANITELMKVGFTNKEFECYPVTRDLYKPKFTEKNSPVAIKKVDYPELNEQGSLF